MERHKELDNYQKYIWIKYSYSYNIFNGYFSSIAEKTKVNFKFSNKQFGDFLHHPNEESFFIAVTDAHTG